MHANTNIPLAIASVLLSVVLTLQSISLGEENNAEVRIAVVGPRALRDAIRILEHQLDCVITYEDPKYQHATTLHQAFETGPMLPKFRSITFAYNPKKETDKTRIIESLLDQYHQHDKTVVFKVFKSSTCEDIFNVVPVSSTNKAGELTSHNSVLDAVVSLTATESTYYAIAEQVCNLASKKPENPTIWLGRPPTQAFFKTPMSIIAKSHALSHLNMLVCEYNKMGEGRVSWNIVRDPNNDFCALNFYPITPTLQKESMPVTVHIEAYRPLSNLVRMLEADLGTPITYEDVQYICHCDVLTNLDGEPQVPRGGILAFSYSSQANPAQVVLNAIEAYNKQGNPGEFALKQTEGVLHVLPIAGRDKNGEWIAHKSLLETRISFSANLKSAQEILELLCESITEKTRQKVLLGSFPVLSPPTPMFSFTVDDKPSRLCLVELMKLWGDNFSWDFLYEPHLNGYVLNTYKRSNGSHKTARDMKE